MISRIKQKISRAWFNFQCAGVFDTPPVKCDPGSNVVIVSQLHHPDLTMYMLAAKSFARFVKPQSFVIVDDGLLPEDKEILTKHFGAIRFVPRKSVQRGKCPDGGCWERLLTLSDVNREHYAIQLDSDTLTLAEPTEVLQSIAHDQTFTLGTSSGQYFVGFEQASRFAHENACEHIQNQAERALGEYPGREHLKYVRGCAGLTGFSVGQLPKEKIEEFSSLMETLLGREKWCKWGTEQVTSNYMAANAPDALVLPVDRYPFWVPGEDITRAVLIHFFGSFRFSEGRYLQHARQIIKQLH